MECNHQDNYLSIMTTSRNMIIKGKRTKRPPPSSPLSLTIPSTSSSTTTTVTVTDNHPQNPNTTTTTTTTSIEFTKLLQQNQDQDQDQEQQQQDIVNSLILLSQTQPTPPPPPPPPKPQDSTYECKTCNRGFSSFQALGGHRASHKKPSNQQHMINNTRTHDLSLQIGCTTHNNTTQSSIKVTKIHECSICGAEFGSGQALGGHMRRHRSMPMATFQDSKKPKTLPCNLDLNLPAPIEDEVRETKFEPFLMKDQMIVFSNSSALVHCHF